MKDNKVALTVFFHQWEAFSWCEAGSRDSKWGEAREPIPHENVNWVIKHKLFNGVIMGCLNALYYMNLEAECKLACVPITEESKDYLSFLFFFLFLIYFLFLFFGFCPFPDCFAEITTSLGNPGEDWPSCYQPYTKNRNWGQLFMWFNGQLDRPVYPRYDDSQSFQLAFIGGTIRVELSPV